MMDTFCGLGILDSKRETYKNLNSLLVKDRMCLNGGYELIVIFDYPYDGYGHLSSEKSSSTWTLLKDGDEINKGDGDLETAEKYLRTVLGQSVVIDKALSSVDDW